MMGSRRIFLHQHGLFYEEGRRRIAEPPNGWWFKSVGSERRRHQATNALAIPRGDEVDVLEMSKTR